MKLSAIKRIENEAHKVGGVITLAQGIPSIPSDDLIRNFVIKAIRDGKVDHYSLSAGLPELRELALKKFNAPKGHEIIVTAGAIEALSAVFLSLCQPGDEVIGFSPYYAPYKSIIEITGAKYIADTLEEENNWHPNLDSFEKKITSKTKIIFICTPHNPTSVVFSRSELDHIGELAVKHNLIIVSDDVYKNFLYDNHDKYSLLDNPAYSSRLITIESFSKDFSLSGWRVGFLLGPVNLLEKIYGVHDNLINCAPVVSQYAALAALAHDEEILQKVLPEYAKRRELMNQELEKLQDYLDFVKPEGSYYVFPKIKGLENSEDFCFDMVREAKVATVPGSAFGSGGEGHVRLCFGRSEEDIKDGMQRFGKYLKNWASRKKF